MDFKLAIMNIKKTLSMKIICLLFVNLFLWEIYPAEDSLPLLRVFPIYRKEECEWAIRWDVCLSCMRQGEKYAQKIIFLEDKPYRLHGCMHPKKGFYSWEEEFKK
jgi:hypothetical protein